MQSVLNGWTDGRTQFPLVLNSRSPAIRCLQQQKQLMLGLISKRFVNLVLQQRWISRADGVRISQQRSSVLSSSTWTLWSRAQDLTMTCIQ